jgi:hypothetical protein
MKTSFGVSRGANFFGRESETLGPADEKSCENELDDSLRHLTRPKGDNVALRVRLREVDKNIRIINKC